MNGDGLDDVVSFTRGSTGDVYVALSNGSGFPGARQLWHGDFAFHNEFPMLGDFNGDRRHDAVSFARGPAGGVTVALSDGGRFLTPQVWRTGFALGDQLPNVGDFNGDGRDDIVAFGRASNGTVQVSLSNVSSGFDSPTLWAAGFAPNNSLPYVGDFNGDGRDDIAEFTRGTGGDVKVALSNGSTFVPAGFWHRDFAFRHEVPDVGDFNGDGRDDIVTFARGGSGDAYVALSNGSSFVGTGSLWVSFFSLLDQIPGAGDFNGDGRDDIASFRRGNNGSVIVGTSTGSRFQSTLVPWHDTISFHDEVPQPSSIIGPIYW